MEENKLIITEIDKMYYEKMITIITEKPVHYSSTIFYNKDLTAWINEKTPLLQDAKYKLKTKIYWILKGITAFPICPLCKCNICKNVRSIVDGYESRFCSTKCSNNDLEVKKKKENTCKENFGCLYPMQNIDIMKKSEETCIKKYGVKHAIQNEEIYNKAKQSWLNNLGVENPSYSKDVVDKRNKNNIEKYGVKCTLQNPEIKLKAEKTCEEKYGMKNPSGNIDVIKKRQNTCQEKYGVINTSKLKSVQDKMIQTNLNHRNVKYPSQDKKVIEKYKISIAKRLYENFLKSNTIPLFTKDYFIQYQLSNSNEPLKWQCKKCGQIFEGIVDMNFRGSHRIDNNIYSRCLNCYPYTISGVSIREKEVVDFINIIYNGEIQENIKGVMKENKHLELDIYLPELNLAFEFDGLLWHSENNNYNFKINPKIYHLNKTDYCEHEGIQLIHIFENEWIHKKNVVENKIKRLLNIIERKIMFKHCEIRIVDDADAFLFQEENSLKNSNNVTINIGLYYENELVSLMCFNRLDNLLYDWELVNYCEKIDTTVINGYKEILNYFIKICKPTSIVASVDRRWSNGKDLEELKFNLETITEPNYWVFCNNGKFILHNKDEIKSIFKTYNNELSEIENMYENGFSRIFDCGNLIYVLRK